MYEAAMPSQVVRSCWCGATRARSWFRVSDSSWIVRCEGCGVSSLWPVPTDEELHKSYARDYYGSTHRKFVEPIASFVDFYQRKRASTISGALNAGGKILDVGCGNGGVLRFLHQKGFRVEGTEWSRESASRIPEKEITVYAGDLVELGLASSSYDTIVVWHVLEHMRDPFDTLAECHRLLIDKGLLYLSVPNAGSWQARLFRSAWFHLDAPRHLNHFDKRSLLLLLRQTGYDVERLSTWSLEQNPYAIAQSLLNSFGFPHQRAYSVFAGTSHSLWLTKALDVTLVSLLVPVAFFLSVIESICGVGGTLSIRARARKQ
jgi:2-polyprenyl-3-methyl-5-hydroxy-6-metoxy-1,4-benzoquinol methylase